MPRTTIAIPHDLNLLLEGAVNTGEFSSKSSAVAEIVEQHFETDEGYRFAAVAGLISLAESDEFDYPMNPQETFRFADVSDEHYKSAIADLLGVQLDDEGELVEQSSLLEEITRSVSPDFDSSKPR